MRGTRVLQQEVVHPNPGHPKGKNMPASPTLSPEVIEQAMRRAFVLARRGPEKNENPQVGCVILGPTGQPVSEGWHLGAGTPHAEAMALANLPADARLVAAELTAVVSLEPCNHTGRTGPCAQALIGAGIGAVVYALADPGNASSGGAATLRAAGVAVTGGVLEAEARELLTPWLALRLPRPQVTVKWAQTLDGRAAAADGSSQWITGPEARQDVHRRRAAADAILVGTGTLFADNPSLTARDPQGGLLVPPSEQPVPIVLGKRNIPADARVRSHPSLGVNENGRGFTEPIHLDGTDMAADLAQLAKLGIGSVFVEGGPTVVSALLREGLADELLIYVAPSLLGGPMLALGDIGITSMAGIAHLEIRETRQLGEDILYRAVLASPHADLPTNIPTTTSTQEAS